jgi:small-conductance mechanosensitive channel
LELILVNLVVQEVAELREQLHEMKSQMSSLKSEQHKKMNIIVRMQGEIRTDMLDIKSNMQFLSESVTALISSSMDAILSKFREISVDNAAGASDPVHQVRSSGTVNS